MYALKSFFIIGFSGVRSQRSLRSTLSSCTISKNWRLYLSTCSSTVRLQHTGHVPTGCVQLPFRVINPRQMDFGRGVMENENEDNMGAGEGAHVDSGYMAWTVGERRPRAKRN